MLKVKKILRNSTAFLLALVVLVATVGISVNKAICLSSGKVMVSVMSTPSCCPAAMEREQPANTIEPVCCEFTQVAQQLDVRNAPLPQLKVTPQAIHLLWQPVEVTASQILEQDFFFYTDASPPPEGRQRLILHQTFLI